MLFDITIGCIFSFFIIAFIMCMIYSSVHRLVDESGEYKVIQDDLQYKPKIKIKVLFFKMWSDVPTIAGRLDPVVCNTPEDAERKAQEFIKKYRTNTKVVKSGSV